MNLKNYSTHSLVKKRNENVRNIFTKNIFTKNIFTKNTITKNIFTKNITKNIFTKNIFIKNSARSKYFYIFFILYKLNITGLRKN